MLQFNVVLEGFKALYPNGGIFQDLNYYGKTTYFVHYKEGGKCYRFTANNHLELAKQLKVAKSNWMYKHELNQLKYTLEAEEERLAEDGQEDIFFGEVVEYTEEEKEKMIKKIQELKKKIEEAYIVD